MPFGPYFITDLPLFSLYLTYTVIFAIDILEVVAVLAFAEVAAKRVHALSVVWAQVLSGDTLVNICTDTDTDTVCHMDDTYFAHLEDKQS